MSMRRVLATVQAVIVLLGAATATNVAARAADCQAVAESMTTMERQLAEGWQEKNAGGQEDLARVTARSVVDALEEMPPGSFSCLSDERKMRFYVLVSKANVLNATLELQSRAIRSGNIAIAKTIVHDARPYRAASSIYWRAINDDLAKVQRRYADVARAEANAAYRKRQAILRVTHGADSPEDASRLAGIDARTQAARKSRSSAAGVSARCGRANAPAITIRSVEPDTPPMAAQQGISGTVQVVVSLDAQSRVTATRVQSSPSAILNEAALTAARESTFQTEIRGCRPVAADFIFSVEFASQ